MRASRAMVMAALWAGLWSLGAAPSVSAQVCGDADSSGSVTVTDGVQTLRSAAGLSSSCTNASCDVDGSGAVSVTDGVNVLRKAAGIAITENCPGGGDLGDVQEITDALVPFLTFALDEVPNVSAASAGTAQPAGSEDCEDGGTRTTNQSGVTVTVTFSACKVSEPGIGAFQLDGFIEAELGFPSASVEFELNVTDLGSGRLVDFDGTISATSRFPQGGFVLDGGPVVVRESEGGPEVFRLTFDNLTVDDDADIISGSVEAEDTSNSFDLKTVELEVEDGSTLAQLRVRRDDDSEELFLLNLETGEITPDT